MTKVRVLNLTCVLLSPHDGVPPEPVKLSFLDASWILSSPRTAAAVQHRTSNPLPRRRAQGTLAGKFTHVDSTGDLVISFSGDGEDRVDYIWAEAEGSISSCSRTTSTTTSRRSSIRLYVKFNNRRELSMRTIVVSSASIASLKNRGVSAHRLSTLGIRAYRHSSVDLMASSSLLKSYPPSRLRLSWLFRPPCEAVAKASELLAGGNEGFKAACAAVQKARWITNPFPRGLQMNRLVIVAGSPRFRVYDVDFGWGGARRVEMVSPDGNREAALLAARGGVQLSVSTSRLCMDALASSFVDERRPNVQA
ncbi:unnamed protein product [Spirodela intermedia]|uniref:Uncharacterized protein n=1 Tax=Spirodela intermedia TaxID=51605 RepID=A0A7I8JHG8_SPIIN|nr:unnamed protein product [Spirodela intermedia]CAA6668862.1 unnamed protein product [Spirodela intermedia]